MYKINLLTFSNLNRPASSKVAGFSGAAMLLQNLKISDMKNLRSITKNEARQIINDNNEYIVWANGKHIESEELVNEFGLTQYDNQPDGAMNLEHKVEDFRIEDIIF